MRQWHRQRGGSHLEGSRVACTHNDGRFLPRSSPNDPRGSWQQHDHRALSFTSAQQAEPNVRPGVSRNPTRRR